MIVILSVICRGDEEIGLTIGKDKIITTVDLAKTLGSKVSKGPIRPDPEGLIFLKSYHLLDLKTQERAVGMLAYCSQMISHFSNKIGKLITIHILPCHAHIMYHLESTCLRSKPILRTSHLGPPLFRMMGPVLLPNPDASREASFCCRIPHRCWGFKRVGPIPYWPQIPTVRKQTVCYVLLSHASCVGAMKKACFIHF